MAIFEMSKSKPKQIFFIYEIITYYSLTGGPRPDPLISDEDDDDFFLDPRSGRAAGGGGD